MGIFDEIIKGVGSHFSGGEGEGGLMDQVLNLINDPQSGGLSGLVEKFNSSGLGDVISSWISTGENQAVTGEQIEQTLGSDKIQAIAEKLGISGTDASEKLAALLPQIVDKLTPDGTIPEGGLLDQGLDFLKKKLLGG